MDNTVKTSEKKKNKLVMPIVKWVGGKRQLLNDIEEKMPRTFGTYYEPFFGGGAVLFHLQPKKAVINDLNKDLMLTYQVVKDNPNELLESLFKHENTSEYFYSIRDKDRSSIFYSSMPRIDKASRLIYLNKTCYNGLFRVNSSGQFNTPFGAYKNPNIVNEPVIRAVSIYLNQNEVEILTGDFAKAVASAKKGDFVYFDPPYYPMSDTANFTGYNEGGFDDKEQIRLRDLCIELDKKGIYFMVSNSSAKFILDAYKDFNIDYVKARRSVNSNASGRGEIDEVIITNYGKDKNRASMGENILKV